VLVLLLVIVIDGTEHSRLGEDETDYEHE